LALLAVACSGATGSTTITVGEGASSPEEAVAELRSLLSEGDFAAASSLAVPDQAALASLAEGASTGEVADALESDDAEVVASFWEGFAQGAGDTFTGEATIEERGTTSEGGVEFYLVGLTPQSGVEQMIVTREIDGQRIDLFASFGAGLAEDMRSPVEIMLGSLGADSNVVLAALQDVVPSLLVAASDDSLSPETVQEILQLVELITRVG
jgi:hypothetical protein